MKMSIRSKELLTGIVGLTLFFGSFLCAEIAYRLIQYARFGMIEITNANNNETVNNGKTTNNHPSIKKKNGNSYPNPFYKDENSNLRLPYPSQTLGKVRINNHGFRGPDIAKEKPKQTLRFAFLGSSTTYDAYVDEKDNWPEQTIQNLRQEIKGCQLEYINAGLPGFSTEHMESYWETKVEKFNIDVVILLPGDMTSDLQRNAKKEGYNSGQHINKSWLSNYSLLYEKIEKNIKVIKAQRSAFAKEGKYNPDISSLSIDFGYRLKKAIETLISDGVFVAVPTISSHVRKNMTQREQIFAANSALFYMPYISIPTLIHAQDKYNEVIRETIKVTDALLIDNEDIIPSDNIHFADSRHFFAKGSVLMGKRISEALLSSNKFETIISQCMNGNNEMKD